MTGGKGYDKEGSFMKNIDTFPVNQKERIGLQFMLLPHPGKGEAPPLPIPVTYPYIPVRSPFDS